MHKVLILGAGKIGSLISGLLAETGEYEVHVADVNGDVARAVVGAHRLDNLYAHGFDARDPAALAAQLRAHPVHAVISSLPYYCNVVVAEAARAACIHYFDLTEDVAVTRKVRRLADGADQAFVPQCGLASRLAALGRRTVGTLRQATLEQLQQHLCDLLPAPLLSATEEGPNSRERIFSLRLTFECFIWQVLKPKTSCREVVRQVQAVFRLRGRGWIDENDSAYIQARQRLPQERLKKALSTTAQAADRRAGSGGQLNGRPVKVADASLGAGGRHPQKPETLPAISRAKARLRLSDPQIHGALFLVQWSDPQCDAGQPP